MSVRSLYYTTVCYVVLYVRIRAYLRIARDGAECNLAEFLLEERAVRDAADGHALLGQDDGAVLAVEHETHDVLLRHLWQLLVEDFLTHIA